MTVVLSIFSALMSAGVFYLTGLYTEWYWYFIPVLLFFPMYVVAFVIAVLLAGIPGLFVSKKKDIDAPSPFFYRTMVAFIRQFLLILRVKVHISGLEKLPKENFVAVYNHISIFDPLALMIHVPIKRFVMISKPENEKIPIIGKYMHMSGYLIIDRKSPMKAKKTTDKAAAWVRDGVASVAISPEGTRSKTGELLPFRAAPFSVAKKSGAPLVIMTVKNTEKVVKNFLFRRTHVYVDVVDVIDPSCYDSVSSFELSNMVREKMLEGLGQTEQG